MRIPSRVQFPFGYDVLIRQVSDAEMLDVLEAEEPQDISDGAWIVDTRTIYIRKALPVQRRKYILSHELGHALWDWQHECMNWGAMKP